MSLGEVTRSLEGAGKVAKALQIFLLLEQWMRRREKQGQPNRGRENYYTPIL